MLTKWLNHSLVTRISPLAYWWQEASISHLVDLSVGLLENLNGMVIGFPQSKGFKRERERGHPGRSQCLCNLASEVILHHICYIP